MNLIIVAILLLGYLLIATENLTNVSKAAVAIFMAAVGWVLYLSYGTDFVMSLHPQEYSRFLDGVSSNSSIVKQFIASYVFIPYVGRAAEVVLFLLTTMTIVEILNNNGCFDFIRPLLHTRQSQKMLWMLAISTFVISANLDNLTTTVMMLTMMHQVVPNRRQRMVYGSAIVIAANCGGALTVIGDANGLVLWNMNAVSATNYSVALMVPCLFSWLAMTLLLGRMLPEHVDTDFVAMPYRGDDTRLNIWQRLLMLIVGIGGLWFIPTFHALTKLSPFLGALCVLAILWIVNEVINRKLLKTEEMIQRRIPRVLQYGVIQMMLFVLGMMLTLGVVRETGALTTVWNLLEEHVSNVWIYGVLSGLVSTVMDNFATGLTFFSLAPVSPGAPEIAMNGNYWKIISYCVMTGGNIMVMGSVSGLALMKMEKMHVGWYFRNVGWKAMLTGVIGFMFMWIIL